MDFEGVVGGEQLDSGVDCFIVKNVWGYIVQGTGRSSRLSNCIEMVRA